MEFKEFENQTEDSLMSEAEKVKLEVLNSRIAQLIDCLIISSIVESLS